MARESLLVKVRVRTALHVRRRSHQVFEGEYGSIHRGRSIDFDDLREYVLGDDVKDIDWKATARSGHPLVKRYVATRRHDIVLVVATGNTMAGLADAVSPKRDVAVLAAGLVGQVAMRHGDAVGLVVAPVVGAPRNTRYLPARRGDAHLERLLRTIHDAIDIDGPPPDLDGLLGDLPRLIRRRSVLIVVADDVDVGPTTERTLRRLAAQHEVLWCTVGDVALTEPALAGRPVRAVGTAALVPAFLRADPALAVDLAAVAQARRRRTRAALARCGVAAAAITGGEGTAIDAVLELLVQQRLFGARR